MDLPAVLSYICRDRRPGSAVGQHRKGPMMPGRLLAIALSFGAVGTVPAAAQDLSFGGLELGYGLQGDGADQADVLVFGGELGVRFGAADMWLSGRAAQADPDDGSPVRDLETGAIGAGYTFDNGMRIDLSTARIAAPALTLSVDELGLGYDSGPFYGRAAYAQVADSSTGVEALTSLLMGYRFAPGAEMSVSAHLVEDAGGTRDTPILVLEGRYDLSDQFGLDGSVSRIDLDGTAFDSVRLGGSYTVNDRYAVFADLEQTRSDALADDVTSLSVGVSVDFGARATSQENSAERILDAGGSGLLLDF